MAERDLGSRCPLSSEFENFMGGHNAVSILKNERLVQPRDKKGQSKTSKKVGMKY